VTLVTLGAEVVAIRTVERAGTVEIRTGLVKPWLFHEMGQTVNTPVPFRTGRAGDKELTAAKIFQEFRYIISIYIDIAVKVTVAWISIGTWIGKCTSPEMIKK
jgi:hypothetical protein